MAETYLEKRARKVLEEEYNYHEENNLLWFTAEVGEEYRKRGQKLGQNINDVGARRALRIELQKKYGLREVEALNVINGFHISEYANKYERIKNKIPTEIIREYISDEEYYDKNGM